MSPAVSVDSQFEVNVWNLAKMNARIATLGHLSGMMLSFPERTEQTRPAAWINKGLQCTRNSFESGWWELWESRTIHPLRIGYPFILPFFPHDAYLTPPCVLLNRSLVDWRCHLGDKLANEEDSELLGSPFSFQLEGGVLIKKWLLNNEPRTSSS